MDALKRLAEKNKKHQALIKAERVEALKLFPLALALIAAYVIGFYYLMIDESVSVFGLVGLSKHAWILSMELSVGIGAVFLLVSVSTLTWVYLLSKTLGLKVKFTKANILFVTSLSLSVLLFMLGKWLTLLIARHAVSISAFLSFNIEPSPFLMKYALSFIIVFIGAALLSVCGFVATFPYTAKKEMLEMMRRSSVTLR